MLRPSPSELSFALSLLAPHAEVSRRQDGYNFHKKASWGKGSSLGPTWSVGVPPHTHSHCGRSQLGCRVEAQVRSGRSRWATRLLLGIRLRAQLEMHPGAEWGGKGREQLPWRHKGSPVLGALLQGEDQDSGPRGRCSAWSFSFLFGGKIIKGRMTGTQEYWHLDE